MSWSSFMEEGARRRTGTFATIVPAIVVFCLLSALSAAAGTTATGVLGQTDFTHNGTNNVSARGLSISEEFFFFFGSAAAIAVDQSTFPNGLYVADTGNNRVLGYVSVSALTNGQAADVVIGPSDFESSSPSTFEIPEGVAVDASGNLYVADTDNNRVLIFHSPLAAKASTGQTTGFRPFMVLGQGGDFNATDCNVGGSAPDAETLCEPTGLALDSSGDLYVSDSGNNRVLEYNNPVGTGTLAASIVFGQGGNFTSNTSNSTSATTLSEPMGLAVDGAGNLYVADPGNDRVLEFNNPLASNPPNTTANTVFGQNGSFSTANCSVSSTGLCEPVAVAVDAAGNVYIADHEESRVLEYNTPLSNGTTAAEVFGQAGNFTSNLCNLGDEAAPASTTLCEPNGVAVDSAGDLIVGDGSNNRVLVYREPTSGAAADVVLGQSDFVHQAANSITGASLNGPGAIALDTSVSPPHLYVIDNQNERVLGWNNASSFANGAAADLVIGQPDFFTSGVAATAANTLDNPNGLAVDSSGNLYVGDTSNSRVLEFNAPFAACGGSFPCIGGSANTVFGQLGSFTADGCNLGSGSGSPSADTLCNPVSVAVDAANNLYIADTGNNRVVEYNTPLLASSEPHSGDTTADLVFGQSGSFSTSGCAASVSATSLSDPQFVALDTSGTVFIEDTQDSRILGYTESALPPTNVTASIVFGQLGSFATSSFGCSLFGVDPGAICGQSSLATDAAGNLYIAEPSFNRVLQFLAPIVSQEAANVVWGQGGDFFSAQCNVGGSTPDAQTLCNPASVAVSPSNAVFIADTDNNRVLQYQPPFPPPGLEVQKRPPTSSGVVTLSRSHLNFGPVRVGRMSKSADVTMANNGSVPVTISRFASSPDFLEANSCGHVIPAGGRCRITVAFRPLSLDARAGHLIISDNAKGGPHAIELRGFGLRRAPKR